MPDTSDKSTFNTRHTLLERVRDPNDEQAWSEFIACYEQYIYNILRHIRIPVSDAKELRQEIIVKLWKKMPDFVYNKDRGKFRQWLGTMIRNDANNYFKKTMRLRKREEMAEDEVLDAFADPQSGYDLEKVIAEEWDHYVSNLAWESIKGQFREKMQKVFLLFTEGKTNKEIAEICNISSSHVRVYIHRIRSHLKEEIERFNNELL